MTKLIGDSLKNYYNQNEKSEKLKNFIFIDENISEENNLFERLARKVFKKLLKKNLNKNDLEKFESQYNRIGSASNEFDKFENIADFFGDIIDESFHIAICIDRFHRVETFFSLTDYKKLRSLADNIGVRFILGSTYPIEMLETKNGDNSDLQGVFTNRIYLGAIDICDFISFFENETAKKPKLNPFKERIIYWCGFFPGIFTKCITEISYDHPEASILRTIDTQFDGMEKKLKAKEDLLTEAIKTVIGPMYNTNHDKRKTLCCYGFLKAVDVDYKKKLLSKIFSNDDIESYLGFQEEDGSCYILFSDYYTLRFIKKYRYERDYFPIWRDTESLLRKMVRSRLKLEYGFEYESKIIESNEFLAQADKQRTQEIADFGHNQFDILEYIDTNTLFERFILKKESWKFYNEKVFKGAKAKWKDDFDLLTAIRRPLSHSRNLPDFYHDAERICEKISNAIKDSEILNDAS